MAGSLFVVLTLVGCQVEPRHPDDADTHERARPAPAAVSPVEIATTAAPEAIGPYSQAVRVGSTLYLSGQIGLDPETGQLVEGGIEAETRQVMENLRAVLEAAGSDFGHVVQSQVFLADLEDFAVMNEIYAGFLAEPAPARATVQAARLPRDARIEIMMTAVIP